MRSVSNAIKTVSLVVIAATAIGACTSYTHEMATSPEVASSSAVADVRGENYSTFYSNQTQRVEDEPVSTFSIDVDTAAYSNVRRFINNGYLPPPDAVRIEEMINYFSYGYPSPYNQEVPFSVTAEVAPTPWNSGSQLLHIGIKGYQPAKSHPAPRNLVFLIDVSGSMQSPNKLGLLKKSFQLMVNQLDASDQLSIVVYAGASGLVLPPTAGNQKHRIISALDNLDAGGSTNGGAGIKLAYAIAKANFVEGGVNRVILATDGDFNVGIRSSDRLIQMIKQRKHSGIGLTVLGFGMGNYNDSLLERISNAGDGNAAYIDTLQEANKVLVNEMNQNLITIARDTKIQIEFNPRKVSSYRLIGYENRILEREDFDNDRVDAGDLGAGHSVTALYEIYLNENLRYAEPTQDNGQHSNELAFVKIRYKKPMDSISRKIDHPIPDFATEADPKSSSEDFRFAAAVAAFGQILRNDDHVAHYSYDDVLALARNSRGRDEFGYRGEFLKLVDLARSLSQY